MPYMYILKCCDNTYYVGSTWNLEKRVVEHNEGFGANYTSKRLPVELVYYEYFDRIDEAFYREKQIQNWSQKKKKALMDKQKDILTTLSRNRTEYPILKDNSLYRCLDKLDSRCLDRLDDRPLIEPVEMSIVERKNIV